MLGIVSDIICVFLRGVCCAYKPPIMLAPNDTLKDVIRPVCSTATQSRITPYTNALCFREKVHIWKGKDVDVHFNERDNHARLTYISKMTRKQIKLIGNGFMHTLLRRVHAADSEACH